MVSSCLSRILSRTKNFSLTGVGYTKWTQKLPAPDTVGEGASGGVEGAGAYALLQRGELSQACSTGYSGGCGYKAAPTYNPEAFLPEEVRNAIYNDRRWFDRSKYLPEGSDEDPFMYLDTQIYDALHALTELQRRFCSARSSMASPLNPSHRTNSVRPGTSGISELVRFDRYGPKSKDVKATAGPTLPALFCCLCCLLVFRLLAGRTALGRISLAGVCGCSA